MINIIRGDALQEIVKFSKDYFGGIITDPPYSSGGYGASATKQTTADKYTATKRKCPYPNFEGDNKDQRSWTSWMAEWMGIAREKCKAGAPIVVFIDWRQLPSMTDALQWSGWIWRGVAVWDKLNSRPQQGRFRQQAEFIVWGSNGAMPVDRKAPVLPGVFGVAMPSPGERLHQTQKPLDLMRKLVHICEPGSHILDPFAGSGTTLEAARMEGYDATGIELSEEYGAVCQERLSQC